MKIIRPAVRRRVTHTRLSPERRELLVRCQRAGLVAPPPVARPGMSRRAFLQTTVVGASSAATVGCPALLAGAVSLLASLFLIRALVRVQEDVDTELVVENPSEIEVPGVRVVSGLVDSDRVFDPSLLTFEELRPFFLEEVVELVDVDSASETRSNLALPGSATPGGFWVSGVMQSNRIEEDARFDADDELQVAT